MQSEVKIIHIIVQNYTYYSARSRWTKQQQKSNSYQNFKVLISTASQKTTVIKDISRVSANICSDYKDKDSEIKSLRATGGNIHWKHKSNEDKIKELPI